MPGDESDKHEIPEMPDTSHVDAKIKDIQSRAETIRQRQKEEDAAKQQTRAASYKDAQSLGAGLQIFYALVGFPLLGFGIGALIDKLTGQNLFKGLCGFLGCILAIVGAGYLIKKSNSQT